MTKWVSIPEYIKLSGLSRSSINELIEKGEIIAIKTEGGGQTRIKIEENKEIEYLKKELIDTKNTLRNLCLHLGMKGV